MVETTVTGAILAAYDRLSESERRVADFILAGTAEISTLMAGEVAERSKTSNTTVSRFVRALGYDSYAEMRIALAREEAAKSASGEEDSPQGISVDDMEASVRFILDQKEAELEDTVAQLDLDELSAIVDMIRSADSVLVAGVGTSLAFAQMLAIKLSHAGVRAIAPASSDSAIALTPTLTGRDCILLVSNSGRSKRLEAIFDIADDEAIRTALLTGDGLSPAARRAGHVITVSVRDQIFADGVVLSHNSLNFVGEIITQLLLHSNDSAPESLRQYSRSVRHALKE